MLNLRCRSCLFPDSSDPFDRIRTELPKSIRPVRSRPSITRSTVVVTLPNTSSNPSRCHKIRRHRSRQALYLIWTEQYPIHGPNIFFSIDCMHTARSVAPVLSPVTRSAPSRTFTVVRSLPGAPYRIPNPDATQR